MDRHAAVVAGPQGDPHRPVNGQRQHEAVVVVGMLADEVDPAGGTDDPPRHLAETLREMLGDVLFTKGHGRRVLLRWDRHTPPRAQGFPLLDHFVTRRQGARPGDQAGSGAERNSGVAAACKVCTAAAAASTAAASPWASMATW